MADLGTTDKDEFLTHSPKVALKRNEGSGYLCAGCVSHSHRASWPSSSEEGGRRYPPQKRCSPGPILQWAPSFHLNS